MTCTITPQIFRGMSRIAVLCTCSAILALSSGADAGVGGLGGGVGGGHGLGGSVGGSVGGVGASAGASVGGSGAAAGAGVSGGAAGLGASAGAGVSAGAGGASGGAGVAGPGGLGAGSAGGLGSNGSLGASASASAGPASAGMSSGPDAAGAGVSGAAGSLSGPDPLDPYLDDLARGRHSRRQWEQGCSELSCRMRWHPMASAPPDAGWVTVARVHRHPHVSWTHRRYVAASDPVRRIRTHRVPKAPVSSPPDAVAMQTPSQKADTLRRLKEAFPHRSEMVGVDLKRSATSARR